MSTTINIMHIVFRTKGRKSSIPEENKRMMFKYIYQLCQSNGWYLYRINGYLNHIHILIDVPTSEKVSVVVQKIKANTSRVFKRHQLFPEFDGWGKRYGAFGVSYKDKANVIDYIKNQETHHQQTSFKDEIKHLFNSNGLVIDMDFFHDNDSSVEQEPC